MPGSSVTCQTRSFQAPIRCAVRRSEVTDRRRGHGAVDRGARRCSSAGLEARGSAYRYDVISPTAEIRLSNASESYCVVPLVGATILSRMP